MTERGVKALYFLLVKKAKIENIGAFLKDGDETSVVLPVTKTLQKKASLSPTR